MRNSRQNWKDYRKGIKGDYKIAGKVFSGYTAYTFPQSIRRRIAGVSLVSVVAAGFGFVAASNNPTAPERFDAKGIELEGGTVLRIGESGKPEFSFELLNHPDLSGNKIPQIGYHGHLGSETTQSSDMTINGGLTAFDPLDLSGDGLRAFNMNVGKGKNKPQCKIVYVRFLTPDDVVRVWTADVRNEFEVSVEPNIIKACWSGIEEHPLDDPDIVVMVHSPAKGLGGPMSRNFSIQKNS